MTPTRNAATQFFGKPVSARKAGKKYLLTFENLYYTYGRQNIIITIYRRAD